MASRSLYGGRNCDSSFADGGSRDRCADVACNRTDGRDWGGVYYRHDVSARGTDRCASSHQHDGDGSGLCKDGAGSDRGARNGGGNRCRGAQRVDRDGRAYACRRVRSWNGQRSTAWRCRCTVDVASDGSGSVRAIEKIDCSVKCMIGAVIESAVGAVDEDEIGRKAVLDAQIRALNR